LNTKAHIDVAAMAASHSIERDCATSNFFEGALMGNGGMGAVVCIRPDAVQIHFGHNSVWDIRVFEPSMKDLRTFGEVFAKVQAVDDKIRPSDDPWCKDYIHVCRDGYARPYPRPMPCGTLILGFDRREAEALGYRLDIATGTCEVYFLIGGRRRTLQVVVDMQQDHLWLRMLDQAGKAAPAPFNRVRLLPDPETPRDLPPFSPCNNESAGVLGFRQVTSHLPPPPEGSTPPYAASHPKDRAFRLSVRVPGRLSKKGYLNGHGTWLDMGPLECVLEGAAPFVVVAKLDQGLASDLPDAPADLPQPDWASFESAAGATVESWREYWAKSAVSLGDPLLEEVWYRNLYFLNCSARAGVTCPGLFANWSFRSIGAAWHGDYHMNYNTQQPFWVTFSSNHLDKHLPYVDLVDHLLPVSQAWARDYYGLRGAFFPHSAYPVEMNVMPYPVPTWGWEVCETPWTVQSLWWHWLYSQDKDFLARRAFEPIRQAVLFLVDYMMRPEARGPQWGDDRYHIFPTVPPELYGLSEGLKFNRDCLADLTLTKFVFRAFLDACRILGCQQEQQELAGKVQAILDRFPPYPTADSPRGKVFVSAPGETCEMVYNYPVSVMTVFPGEEHGLDSPPDQLALAANSYRQQQNEGGNDLVALNLPAARLGMLDLERFKRQIRYCMLPNGTCTDLAMQAHGRYYDTNHFDFMAPMGVWFENFALPVVVNECLMQSYNGTIRLFPNWPMEQRAAFQTLRAVGAFLVSAACADGAVQWVEVHSEAGGLLRVVNPWPAAVRCVIDGKATVCEGAVLQVQTSPGQTVRFTKA
jgi:hypothetical protein